MAQLKNTTILDTGNLDLPAGTTAQRPSTPSEGMIRYNTTLAETEYYDGTDWRSISDSNPEATGGTIVDTDIGGIPYRIHLFTTTGNSTFAVSKGGEVDYLIVAGGGGGGSKSKGSSGGTAGGAGGGGGGVLTGKTILSPQTYTITIGVGGQGGGFPSGGGTTQSGGNGGNSSAFGLTAIGGGGGAQNGALSGSSGGSGGGAASFSNGGAGTAGQGNRGGNFVGSADSSFYPRAGGGGAGSVGGDAINGVQAGRGGSGILSTITGSPQWYAGGGGGSWRNGSDTSGAAYGGLGGGQNGGIQSGNTIVNGFYGDNLPMPSGIPNTGGGGGGQGGSSVNLLGHGGFGGSGVVIVRYRRNISSATVSSDTIVSTLPLTFNADISTKIVRNGLGLELDSYNPLSYPGAGGTWFDLSGNGRNFTGNASYIGVNEGITAGATWTCPASLVGGLLNNDFHTVCFTIKFNTTDTNTTGFTSGFELFFQHGDRSPNIWRNPNSRRFHWRYNPSNTGVDFDLPGGGNLPLNTWIFVSFVKSGNTGKGYINGVLSQTNNTVAYPSVLGSYNITLFPSYTPFLASISNMFIYDRVLSDNEIKQNYNAVRTRFGI